MGVVKSVAENCKYCLGCIRVCPVKALKSVEEEYFEVIEDRCIDCGICAFACTQGALIVESDIDRAKELLSHRDVIAVLTTEYPAAFYPYQPEVAVGAFEQAGFMAVEDTNLAEEFVAKEYLDYFNKKSKSTIIRSTCPTVVKYFEIFHSELLPYLAPIISPMVAAGRLYKEMYGHDTGVIYITPCVSTKAEIKDENVRDSVDVVLTFSEAKKMLEDMDIDLEYVSPSASESIKPVITRNYSARSGFPRKILSDFRHDDKDIKVVRGFDELEELAVGLEKDLLKPRIVDTLFCASCIEGPSMATSLSLFARKRIVEEYQAEKARSKRKVTLDQIYPRLPYIKSERIFRYKIADTKKPTPEEIEKILAQGERNTREAIFDCGACGYETCYEHAVAIFYGYSDWSRCSPYQRKIFSKVLRQLKEASNTDGLTGLNNHRAFLDRLEQEFHRAKRYGSELSILMIDLDGFKAINDNYGHIKGDEVLRKIAGVLKENVRTSDFIARYGGDEFSIILPETSKGETYSVAEKLREAVEEEKFKLDGKVLNLSISTGAATLTNSQKSYFDLIGEADKAMYKSKEQGKNRTTFADEISREKEKKLAEEEEGEKEQQELQQEKQENMEELEEIEEVEDIEDIEEIEEKRLEEIENIKKIFEDLEGENDKN